MMLDQENKINTTSPQGRTNSSRAYFHILLVCFIKIEEKSY